MIIMRLERTMIQYGIASIPVMIGSTQKSATGDMLHMCCTECDSKVSQKNFCSNESCSLHEVIPNERNSTNRYIDLDKENSKILKLFCTKFWASFDSVFMFHLLFSTRLCKIIDSNDIFIQH